MQSFYLAENLLQTDLLSTLCTQLNRRVAIITDSHLADSYGRSLQQRLHRQGHAADLFIFPAGESHKTRATKEYLEDELQRKQYGRDCCLLALGGGVVTDLVGFLAATYCRGVPVVYLPTTLLAMVDASIGGKTSVNTPLGKNLIGTFTQPYAVCIDPATLQTLPDCEWRNGIVEMMKHALLADAALFTQMQDWHDLPTLQARGDWLALIEKNYLIKKSMVAQDPHEQGIRQLLNFGHTIGHAIESLQNYQISHGEAVAIGMLVEGFLAVQSGYLSAASLETMRVLLTTYALPLKTTAFQAKSLFLERLTLDKKSIQSRPRFVLLAGIGQPYVHAGQYTHEVHPQHLADALDWAIEHF